MTNQFKCRGGTTLGVMMRIGKVIVVEYGQLIYMGGGERSMCKALAMETGAYQPMKNGKIWLLEYGGYYDYIQDLSVKDDNNSYIRLIEGGSSGFGARLGGYRYTPGTFRKLGVIGYYWSATEADGGDAFSYGFSRAGESLNRSDDDQGARLLSTLPPELVFYLIIFKSNK